LLRWESDRKIPENFPVGQKDTHTHTHKHKKEKEKKAYRIREQNDVIYKVYCKTLRSLWDPVSGEPVIKLFSKSGCSDWTTTGTRYDHFVPLTAHDDAHKRTFPLPVDLVPEVQFSEMPFSLDGETEEVRHQGMRNVLRFIQDKTAPNPAPVRPIPSVGKLDMKKGDEHRLTVRNEMKVKTYRMLKCGVDGMEIVEKFTQPREAAVDEGPKIKKEVAQLTLNLEDVCRVVKRAKESGVDWRSQDMAVLCALLEEKLGPAQYPQMSLRAGSLVGQDVAVEAVTQLRKFAPQFAASKPVLHDVARDGNSLDNATLFDLHGNWKGAFEFRVRKGLHFVQNIAEYEGELTAVGAVQGPESLSNFIHPFFTNKATQSALHDLPAATLLNRAISVWETPSPV